MMGRLLACWFTLLVLVGLTAAPAVARDNAPLRRSMPANTRVTYIDCGVTNGFYHPATGRVYICNENVSLPKGVQNFILFHELAHAVIDRHDIPYTGLEEAAADEYAALVMLENGRADEVIQAGEWMMAAGGEDNPADLHLSNKRRGLTLLCMAMQKEYGLTSDLCTVNYETVKKTWGKLLDGVEE